MSELRVPPQAIEVERAVLGAMLLDREAVAKVIGTLDPDAFYDPTNERIYKAMLALFEESLPIDAVTIVQKLKAMGNGRPEDAIAVTDLLQGVTSSANVEYHARIVLDRAMSRKLIRVGSEIATRAYSETEDVGTLLDEIESNVFKISERRTKKSFTTLKDGIHSALSYLEEIHATKGKSLVGVASGYHALDGMTGGFQKSDLIIVAGRPGSGKTAIAMCIAKHAAMNQGIKAAVFSLEMSEKQLVIRLLASEAKVDQSALRMGKLSSEGWKAVSAIAPRLASAGMLIDDSASISILELRAKARRLQAEYGIGLVVVDYLQLVTGPKNVESREREVAMISRSLKALAKELDVPVIALSQLNRALEARTDKQPTLADLRESGAVEQDADVVLFVHRPEMFKMETVQDYDGTEMPSAGIAEIIIGKQRNGPTGKVLLSFKKEYAGFENLAIEYPPEPTMAPPTRSFYETEEPF